MYKHPPRAPLKMNTQRFFRGYKAPKKFKLPVHIIRTVLLGLYSFFLLAIDLLLFADSGNLDIFRGLSLLPELKLILFLSFIASQAALFLLYRWKKLQNLLCGLLTVFFIQALFNQFAEFDADSFLGDALVPIFGRLTPQTCFSASSVVLSVILGFLVFIFLNKVSQRAIGIYVFMFFVAFAGIIRNSYQNSRDLHDFIETSDRQNILPPKNKTEGQKFIYIMLPNLSSYKYFAAQQDIESAETGQIMSGFLAKNNFEVYENAYNKNDSSLLNIVDMLNIFSDDQPENHILDEMLLYRYWKFFNINDEYVFLKDNQLFDSFRKAGYKLTAYKSQGIDICHKNNAFNVDRCIEKLNRPINLYSLSLSMHERAQILTIEWINSMGFFRNMAPLFRFFKNFTKPENLPMIGISYNNLYVLNSIKTFDVLAENILTDKERSAYFIYADIPSDMFIYDQFCTIKPRSEWINMYNLPWVNDDKTALKRHAYIEQTRCIYGKLQEFLDRLNEMDKLHNSMIILQGISTNNNFNTEGRTDYIEDMLYNKLSMFAIKSPKNKEIKINSSICSVKSILRQHLFGGDSCEINDNIKIHDTLKENLKLKLQEYGISEESAKQDISSFDSWYKYWQIVKKISLDRKADIEQRGINDRTSFIIEENTPELIHESLKVQ